MIEKINNLYSIRMPDKWKDYYYAPFEIFITDFPSTPTHKGSIKWDGCCEINEMEDDGETEVEGAKGNNRHTCGYYELERCILIDRKLLEKVKEREMDETRFMEIVIKEDA